ncbi:MAG: hypothetical protein CR972_03495 [Candidatus Moraniibacteriota bacterium]|nr:MAG: hypothetical protein CR972_03495 [Candidatus Moranbacteria bacterium]
MTEENNASNWFQDNLRIIISVGIVILLVFAIYSYSKRNSRTDVVVDDSQIEEIAMTAGEENGDEISDIISEIRDDQENAEEADVITSDIDANATDNVTEQTEQKTAESEKARLAEEKKTQEQAERESEEAKRQKEESQKAEDIAREVIESHSTEDQTRQENGVIAVTAIRGDSMTTLARKAAKSYINKNNVENLTPSHKIYIEDYLRKKQTNRKINVNTEIQFTKSDISEAIEKSRTLTEAQLHNLAFYAQNVPGL